MNFTVLQMQEKENRKKLFFDYMQKNNKLKQKNLQPA